MPPQLRGVPYVSELIQLREELAVLVKIFLICL